MAKRAAQPAASGLAKTAAPRRLPAPLVAEHLAAFEREVGGREALVAALTHAPKGRDLDYVVGILGDPEHLRRPLAECCAIGGVSPGELLEHYRSGVLARGQVLAIKAAAEQLPAVAADTVRMALPEDLTCPACAGTGQITPEPTKKVPNPEPEDCRTCRGTGTWHREGDLDHKKLVLEVAGLAGVRGPGVAVSVNQTNNLAVFGAAGGALERMQAATDQILYGDGQPTAPLDVVDADVVEVGHVDVADEAGDAAAEDPPAAAASARLDPDDWRGDVA